jgi:hypothetical protein
VLRTSRVATPEVLAIERENLPNPKRCTAMPVAQRPCVSLHRAKQLKTKAHLKRSCPHVWIRGLKMSAGRLRFLAWVGAGINPEKFFQS